MNAIGLSVLSQNWTRRLDLRFFLVVFFSHARFLMHKDLQVSCSDIWPPLWLFDHLVDSLLTASFSIHPPCRETWKSFSLWWLYKTCKLLLLHSFSKFQGWPNSIWLHSQQIFFFKNFFLVIMLSGWKNPSCTTPRKSTSCLWMKKACSRERIPTCWKVVQEQIQPKSLFLLIGVWGSKSFFKKSPSTCWVV